MRTEPIHPSALRAFSCACALILLAAASGAGAQERAGYVVGDTRIDQFVTNQDGVAGFGGIAADDDETARFSQADREFLVEAHQLEMMQVHVGAVAQKRKTTQAVASHSRRVLDAHQASLVAIEKIGRTHGLELERDFTPEFQHKAEALQQATDASFGAVFFGQMLELHARTVDLYEQASATTDNADLRSLLDDSLPTLRTQLADAEQFSTTLGTVATAP